MNIEYRRNEELCLHGDLPPADIPEATTISQLVLQRAEQHGEKVALIDAIAEKQMTYAEFLTSVRHVRCGLYKHDVLKGDVVLMLLPNSIEYVVMFHALLSLGGVITTAHQRISADELRIQILESGVSHVVTTPSLLQKLTEATPADYPMKRAFVIGEHEGCISYEDLIQDDASEYPVIFFNVRQDLAIHPFSTGTTGCPKPVKVSHYNLVAEMAKLLHPQANFMAASDVTMLQLSMSHPFVILFHLMASLLSGSTIVILPIRNINALINGIIKYKGTMLTLIPPVIDDLLQQPNLKQVLSSVRTITNTASYVCQKVELQLRAALPPHATFRQVYGMTEAGVMMVSYTRNTPVGSVGRLLPNFDVKVVDMEDGHLCGARETGELWVKGPTVCLGYIPTDHNENPKNPNEDGWFQTGDVFKYDCEGYFYFIDRVKDIIKYEGMQVSPLELESLLKGHPGVSDALVVGVPAPVVGELPKAFIVPTEGSTVSASELIDFVAAQVAPAKRLRGGVEFIDAMPKPVFGKVPRHVFRQLEIDRQKEERSRLQALSAFIPDADSGEDDVAVPAKKLKL